MINQVIMVGRLADEFRIDETKNEKLVYNTLIIQQPHKNKNGVIETDYINFCVSNELANCCIDYCKKGDIIGIKGKLKNVDKNIMINAEKVTFLSSKNIKNEIEQEKNIKI